MAISDFTGQNIQDTYQKVVQTDGTNLADGTGSLLPISIDGNDVTISGSLTANEYIVSSSVTNITIATLSGSTDFGDDTGDTHKFTGSLFISGTAVGINRTPIYMLDVGGTIHTTDVIRSQGLYSTFGTFSGNVNANGNIVGDNNTNISGINTLTTLGNATLGNAVTDAHTVNGTLNASRKLSSTTIVEAPTGSFKRLKGDTTLATGLFIDGTITASGDISQSNGRLFTNHIELVGNNIVHGGDIGLPIQANHVQITDPNNGPIAAANVHSRLVVDGDITINTHITASGNISGSLISTGSFGRVEATTLKGTLSTAAQTNITSVGALTGGSIGSGFGSINVGGNAITTTGTLTSGPIVATNNISLTTTNGHITASGIISASGGFTGSLYGTSSWASNSITSSHTITASYVESASFATTASYVESSSFATTASYVESSSYALSSSHALEAISSSYALTSSYAITASYAVSSSHAISSSYTVSSSHTISSSYALSSSHAVGAFIGSAAEISGSFTEASSSFSTRVTANDAKVGYTDAAVKTKLNTENVISSSAQVPQHIIMTGLTGYMTAMVGPNTNYYYPHDQGIHAGLWNNSVTDPTTFPCEDQHLGFYVPYDIKNVCAKVAFRGQTGADPAFWIYTGSLRTNNNTDVTLGWAASSSAANYNSQATIPSNRTNAQFEAPITGSDSFDVNEGDLMVFYFTNQSSADKAIRWNVTLYGEKA